MAENPQDTVKKDETKTEEELIYRKCYLFPYVFVIGVAGINLGYNLTVLNMLSGVITKTFGWTDEEQTANISWLVSLNSMGAAAISFIGGAIIDRVGRKWTMILTNTIGIVAYGLSAVPVLSVMMLGRLCAGFTTGLFSTLCPLFIRELSPVSIAGKASASYVILFRVGFLQACLVGVGLPSEDDDIDFENNHYWQFMIAFPAIIVVIQSVVLLLCFPSDTPKYLYQNGKVEETKQVLYKIYPLNEHQGIVLGHLSDLLRNEKESEVTWTKLFTRSYAYAIFVVFLLHFFQIMAAGNAFVMYSTTIFRDAGADDSLARLGTMMLGVSSVIGVIAFTALVDILGRRPILIWGCLCLSVSLILLSIFFYTNNYIAEIVVLIICVLLYQSTIGPCAWVYTSEVLPARGVGLATTWNWGVNMAISKACPILFDTPMEAGGVFIMFAGCTTLACIFSCALLKETKGNYDKENKTMYLPSDLKSEDNMAEKNKINSPTHIITSAKLTPKKLQVEPSTQQAPAQLMRESFGILGFWVRKRGGII